MYNYLIAGSGPAGVAAARMLANSGTCILDAGESASPSFTFASLGEALAEGNVRSLLGERWEMLANIVNAHARHSKLRALDLRRLANGEPFQVRDGSGQILIEGNGSYAVGGLSEAWGAQLFRYLERDLHDMGNWPFGAEMLAPYYDDLEEHIGISGVCDDIYNFLGPVKTLLPPPPIVPGAAYLLSKYEAAKKRGKTRGFILGRSRLAILTRPYRGYIPYAFGETEFFSTAVSGLYTAGRTLEELRASGAVTYLGGHKLLSWKEKSEYVEAKVFDIEAGAEKILRTRHLLLGCGVIHTARLVLLNYGEPLRRLPFIDHPPTLVPFFIPAMFGSGLPSQAFPVQLVATMDCEKRDMISLYYPAGMLWSDLLSEMPFPMHLALKLLKNLLGGMLVAQIWEPSWPSARNFLSLNEKYEVEIFYPDRPQYARLKNLMSAMRKLGAFSLQKLQSMAPPGWGFHYAATLPMHENPNAWQSHVDGRLWDSRRVRVIDASVLPSLPAKNHSLTLMANAARIADEAKKCGY